MRAARDVALAPEGRWGEGRVEPGIAAWEDLLDATRERTLEQA